MHLEPEMKTPRAEWSWADSKPGTRGAMLAQLTSSAYRVKHQEPSFQPVRGSSRVHAARAVSTAAGATSLWRPGIEGAGCV